MSKTNYSNYSKFKNVDRDDIDVVDIVETADGAAVYDVKEAPKPKPVIGTVANCNKLNVRVAPNTMATVACVIPVDSKVEVDLKKSTQDWYGVCTESGVEGYCMRKFIKR